MIEHGEVVEGIFDDLSGLRLEKSPENFIIISQQKNYTEIANVVGITLWQSPRGDQLQWRTQNFQVNN